MPSITPFLWFDHQAEEAAAFYTAIFSHSKITGLTRYGDAGPGPAGSAMSVAFELEGRAFVALNGGPHFTFSPAISFFVNCETQAEVDRLWETLTAEGEEGQCGWLTDKFGVSWQIVPAGLSDLLYGADAEKSNRAMQTMLQMRKLDIHALRRAYEQG